MMRKTVAMIVIVAFMTVLGVTAYPLHAQEASPEPAKNAQAQDKPGAVERTGDTSGAPRATSSSALPIVLILVGVGALAAILFLVILKSSYDIRGTWYFSLVYTNSSNHDQGSFVFTGTKESGNVLWDSDEQGTYSITGQNVNIRIYDYYPIPKSNDMIFTGQFTDVDTMSGTFVCPDGHHPGTWTATRTSAATALKSVKK